VTNYGSIPTTIWLPGSPFLQLPATAQRLWLFLCSQPDIRPTGVIPMRPGAWSRAAEGLTRSQVETDLAVLDEAGFTLTDPGTDEVLVCRRMRDCNVFKNGNLMRRISEHVNTVLSAQIRAQLNKELAEASGPVPAETGSLFDVQEPLGQGLPQTLGHSQVGIGTGKALGSVLGLTGTTSGPSRGRARDPQPVPAGAFEAFWGVYPRKVGKQRAVAEFAKALERADLNTLLAGAIAYRDLPGRSPAYTLHASTWLHQDRWTDEHTTAPGPAAAPVSRGQQRVDEHQAAKQEWLNRRGQGHAG
jgi:hypothetical protein